MDSQPPIIPTPAQQQEGITISLLNIELHDYDQRIQASHYRWWGWGLAALAGFLFFGFAGTAFKPSFLSNEEEFNAYIGGMAMCGGVVIGGLYGLAVFLFRRSLFNARRQVEVRLTKANAEQLKESIEDDFFTKLVKINFRYIDQYYHQTQEQANKSFALSCVAAAVGFGIVMLGIIMMFFGKTNPAYVTTAVGTVSQLVSALFFYLYNRTILKMGEYHEKLVLTQNISVALKIAEGLPGDAKIQSQQMLIERLTLDVNLYLSDRPVTVPGRPPK